jgi:MoxR-like ATPase
MLESFRGMRPDITPAQGVATVLAGVPLAANMLRAFGVGGKTQEEVAALNSALAWSGVVAGVLIGSDAALRASRNWASARTEAMAMATVSPMAAADEETALEDVEAFAVLDDELPSDAEELAAPPAPVTS